jgi:phosphoglycolate phosphatase
MKVPDVSSVRALIFDLDGTLIDSKRDLIHSVNATLKELGRAQLREDTISGYIGHGAPQLVGRTLGDGSTEAERERALKFFLAYYEDHKMDSTRAYPGVPEALAHLAAFPMAILTNKPVRISMRILESLGMAKYFRAVYGGNSFETKKPDPLGAQTILREFGRPSRSHADRRFRSGRADRAQCRHLRGHRELWLRHARPRGAPRRPLSRPADGSRPAVN